MQNAVKDIQLRCVHHFIFFIRLLIHLFIYLFMYACSILKFIFLDFRPFVSILPHLYGRQTELHTEM